MATGEKDTFDALCTKLENTCEENGLVYTMQRDRYPFALAGGDDAGDEEDDAESAEE